VTELVLRRLEPSEAEAAYRLERACFAPEAAATLEAIRYRIAHYSAYFWSAWSGERLVGFTNGVLTEAQDTSEESMKGSGHDAYGGRHLCVLSVAVDPAFRRRRIGSLLAGRLVDAARANGLRSVFLMCEAHLIPMYEALGFVYRGPSASRHAGIEWHEMQCRLEGWQA